MIIFLIIGFCFLLIICCWGFIRQNSSKIEGVNGINGIPTYVNASEHENQNVRHLHRLIKLHHQEILNEINNIELSKSTALDDEVLLMNHEQQWCPLWLRYCGQDTAYLEKSPLLLKIIKSIPNIESCYISIMPGGTTISNKTNPFPNLHKYQYMLAGSDNDLGLNIDGFNTTWRLNEGFVWDDTKPYSVWNDSFQKRIVFCAGLKKSHHTLLDIINSVYYEFMKLVTRDDNLQKIINII